MCVCGHHVLTEVFTLGKWALWLSLACSWKVEWARTHTHGHLWSLAAIAAACFYVRSALILSKRLGVCCWLVLGLCLSLRWGLWPVHDEVGAVWDTIIVSPHIWRPWAMCAVPKETGPSSSAPAEGHKEETRIRLRLCIQSESHCP